MEGPAPPVPLERLLAHREWVRRVARALVRDENAADDLEQGVWLEALERPPRSGRSLRGWLGAALRHDLVDRRRSEDRRRVREGACPRPGAAPSPAEIVAEAEAHRRVVDAVMALPEPYRASVLLRYFQDLDSPEISRRMGVPPETVRTRLMRALATLRERLDAGSGGDRDAWRLALLPLARDAGRAGIPAGSGGTALAFGGVLVKTTTKVAVVAALLATGGLCWWALRPGVPAPDAGAEGGPAGPSRPAGPEVAAAPQSPDAAPAPEAGGASSATAPVPGDPDAAKDPQPPPRRVPRERLPMLGNVAALPPEAERIDVEVDERGCVTVGGRILDMEGLGALLRERADAAREDAPPRGSLLHAVLRVDRDLPWQGAQWLMQACAGPEIRIYRIHFAAQSEDGGAEGAVPTFLPKDTGPADGPAVAETLLSARLTFGGDGPSLAPKDLLPFLEARYPDLPREGLKVEIVADPWVPAGDVLGAVDAVRRWGAPSVIFRGTQIFRGDTLERAVAGVPLRAGGLGMTVAGTRVEPR